jgi:hypothetical protein
LTGIYADYHRNGKTLFFIFETWQSYRGKITQKYSVISAGTAGPHLPVCHFPLAQTILQARSFLFGVHVGCP